VYLLQKIAEELLSQTINPFLQIPKLVIDTNRSSLVYSRDLLKDFQKKHSHRLSTQYSSSSKMAKIWCSHAAGFGGLTASCALSTRCI